MKNEKGEIRNYKAISTGRFRGVDKFITCPEEIYRVTYDQYSYPNLVSIIDGLIEGKAHYLHQLINPNYDNELLTVEEKLKELELEILRLGDYEDDRKMLERLFNGLIKIRELNKNQVSVKEYYPLVSQLISIESLDYMKVSDIKDGFFFDEDKNQIFKLIRRINEE